ncbi:hypothetical protein GGR51DRAFT_559377 [Nemania sp. FL0031]|nr:hypothetical protein GGR51DRAFT_559377 [Nemania sp. FL0031]
MSVTIDDITSAPNFGFTTAATELLSDIAELREFHVSRDDTYRWVYRDMKFLVCDESDDGDNSGKEQHSEPMLPPYPEFPGRAVQGHFSVQENWKYLLDTSDRDIWLHSDFTTPDSHPLPRRSNSGEADVSTDVINSEATKQPPIQSCDICSQFPRFPTHRKTRKFRLVCPAKIFEQGMCEHFVAVSYRWADGPRGSAQIMTEATDASHSSIRQSKAPDSIIDRAVAHAVNNGLRFIWIDQECLPQPLLEGRNLTADELSEFQLGVQSMVMVYGRAQTTAGLLNSVTVSRCQIEAIESILHPFWGREVQKWVNSHSDLPSAIRALKDVLDFLRQVTEDVYYTRAWIFQEILSAGSNLSLLMGTEQPQVEDTVMRPTRDYSMGVSIFRRLVDATDIIYKSNLLIQPDKPWRTQLADVDIYGHRGGAQDVASKARLLHPSAPEIKHRPLSGQGSRQTCDAASALTFLRTRRCHDVVDRVAIVANMCNYDVRLNTEMVGRYCPSLRIALLALSVMNNDLSLLIPDAFNAPEEPDAASTSTIAALAPTFIKFPHRVDIRECWHRGVMSTRPNQSGGNSPFSKGALSLHAYKWVVDRKVDMSPIKALYEKKWAARECGAIETSRFSAENESEYQQRCRLVQGAAMRLYRGGLSWRDIQRIAMGDDEKTLTLAKDDVDPLRMPGISVRVVHYSQHIISNSKSRKFYGRIVMRTLSYLYENGEIELANSIWQSLRTDGLGKREELPDQVGEWLDTDERTQKDPWSLLQLDTGRDGTFNQFWLFERIMTDGFLWVGRYQPREIEHRESSRRESSETIREDNSGNPEHSPDEDDKAEKVRRLAISDVFKNISGERFAVVGDKSQLHEVSPHSEQEKETGTLPCLSHHSLTPRSILDQQRVKQILQISLICQFMKRYNTPRLKISQASAVANLAMFTIAKGSDLRSPDVERHRALQVACFDVDEPCLVFTPYDTAREMLPHPNTRTMRVCWVAKPLPISAGSERSLTLRDKSSEDGAPLNTEATALSKGTGHVDSIVEQYEVLKRVKGVWRIMEQPEGKYTFR